MHISTTPFSRLTLPSPNIAFPLVPPLPLLTPKQDLETTERTLEQSVLGQIRTLSDELENILQTPPSRAVDDARIETLIVEICSLRSRNPAVAFNDKALRVGHARYLLEKAPPAIKLFFAYDKELNRKFHEAPLVRQQIISGKFAGYALDWSSTSAYILKSFFFDDIPLQNIPELYSRLSKVKKKSEKHLKNLCGWMQMYPELFKQWLCVAESGLIISLNIVPPEFLYELNANKDLRDSCRYINFHLIKDAFLAAFAADKTLTYQLFIRCKGYPHALGKLLRGATAPQSCDWIKIVPCGWLLELNIQDPQQRQTMQSFLAFLDVNRHFDKSGFRRLASQLVTILQEGDFSLLDRLLDMAKTCDIHDILLLLDKRDAAKQQYDPLVYACLALAGSTYGRLIGKLIKMDQAWNAPIIDFFSKNHFFKGIPELTAYLLEGHSQSYKEKILFVFNHTLLSNRRIAIKEALLKGDYSFVEFIINKPPSMWDTLPCAIQEALWDFKSTLSWSGDFLDLFAPGNNRIDANELRDLIGMAIFLASHDRVGLNKMFICQPSDEYLQTLRDLTETSLRKIADKHRLHECSHALAMPQQQKELVFSNFIAECLLTPSGKINKTFIPALKKSPVFFHFFRDQTPFKKYIKGVLHWLERDPEGISQIITSAYAPDNSNEEAFQLVQNCTGNDAPTDMCVRKAILSALLTKIRQHPERNSCFSTSVAIASLQTYKGLIRAAKEYCELATKGTLSIGVAHGRKTYLLCHKGDPLDPFEGNILARAREYTLAQMDLVSIKKQLEWAKVIFNNGKGRKYPLYYYLYAACLGQGCPELFETIQADITCAANEIIECYYDPTFQTYNGRDQGAWRIRKRGNNPPIESPLEYLTLLQHIADTSKERLLCAHIEGRQHIPAVIDAFKNTIFVKGPSALRGILGAMHGKTNIQTPIRNYKNFKKTPWWNFKGGSNYTIDAAYYSHCKSGRLGAKRASTAELILYALLRYGLDLPASIRHANENPHTNVYINVCLSDHSCNIKTKELLDFIGHQTPEDVISNLKKQAEDFRLLPLSQQARQALLQALIKLLGNSMAAQFADKAKQKTVPQTVGHYLNACLEAASETFLCTQKLGTFTYLWEKHARTILSNNSYSLPPVTALLDLNYISATDGEFGLGFGSSIINNEILEFRIYANNTPPRLINPSVGYCRTAWKFNQTPLI